MTDNMIWILIAVAGVQVIATFLILHSVNSLRGGGGGSVAGERAGAHRLAEQARAVYAKAVTLPPTLLGPGDRQLRLATLWTADEVAALKPTTPLLGAACGEIFGTTEAALAWLLSQATMIREKPAGQGSHLVDFPHEKWKESYNDALDGLHLLETYGEVTAKMADLAR